MRILLAIFSLFLFTQGIVEGQIRIPNINKAPSSGSTSTPPTTQPQNKVAHQNNLKKELLEAGYTVSKVGQNSKHTFYRIIGNIYSLSQEPLYCHNRRIIMFQVEGWDAGFLNDNLQSIDGFQTQYKLNNQGVLYQFGNTTMREFAFDFKVKRGQQHLVRAELIPDWAPLDLYEEHLLIQYEMLSGTYEVAGNADMSFKMQFSPQGEQIVMEDFYKQQVVWTKKEEKTYVRMMGEVPNAAGTTTNAPGGFQTNSNTTNSNTTNSTTKPKDYPAGGYLGNANSNSSTEKPKDYPSGGYLGGANDATTGQTQQTVVPQQAYSSVIQIVDRKTLKYFNSEGIAIELKRKEGM